MTIRISQLTPAAAWARRDEIAAIYAEAFGYDSGHAGHFRDTSLVHIHDYDGALLFAGIQRGRVVGFLYGYTYQPDHWWPHQVGAALTRAGFADWLLDAFELVELEILPHAQGQGLGSELMQALLATTPHQHILLNTLKSPENRAPAFYRKHGFRVLLENVQYIEHGDEYLIMGLARSNDPTQFAF